MSPLPATNQPQADRLDLAGLSRVLDLDVVSVFSAASIARVHLSNLAARGLATVVDRRGDLLCGLPDILGRRIDWVVLFACGHVSRFCVYRSDAEALICEVCEDTRVSSLNAVDLVTRCEHALTMARFSAGQATANTVQSDEVPS